MQKEDEIGAIHGYSPATGRVRSFCNSIAVETRGEINVEHNVEINRQSTNHLQELEECDEETDDLGRTPVPTGTYGVVAVHKRVD